MTARTSTEQPKVQWREIPDTTYGNDTLWFRDADQVLVFADWKEGLWKAALLAHRTGTPVTPECAHYICAPVPPEDLHYRGRLYADALRDTRDCVLHAHRADRRAGSSSAWDRLADELYQQEKEVRAYLASVQEPNPQV